MHISVHTYALHVYLRLNLRKASFHAHVCWVYLFVYRAFVCMCVCMCVYVCVSVCVCVCVCLLVSVYVCTDTCFLLVWDIFRQPCAQLHILATTIVTILMPQHYPYHYSAAIVDYLYKILYIHSHTLTGKW